MWFELKIQRHKFHFCLTSWNITLCFLLTIFNSWLKIFATDYWYVIQKETHDFPKSCINVGLQIIFLLLRFCYLHTIPNWSINHFIDPFYSSLLNLSTFSLFININYRSSSNFKILHSKKEKNHFSRISSGTAKFMSFINLRE